jgi:hypothetical protein
VRFDLRDKNNFEKGWDNTNPLSPWTSCGVERKKADESPWPNSLVYVAIPGCTAELGGLLELVQAPVTGDTEYVSPANQTIQGVITQFDIQGTAATPAGGCQIIVREKANHANKSLPLNVHVFTPRVVKFQVYRANPPAPPETGFVATVAQIKTELNTTYNEQANIRFEELQADTVEVNSITGVFDGNGNMPVTNGAALGKKIHDDVNSAAHLKVVLVKNVIPDQVINRDTLVGVAGYEKDWAIVEASVSQLDTYSHETGHSLVVTSTLRSDGTRHEENSVKAPNGGAPLMRDRNASTRWIKQVDWRQANSEAASARYGN